MRAAIRYHIINSKMGRVGGNREGGGRGKPRKIHLHAYWLIKLRYATLVPNQVHQKAGARPFCNYWPQYLSNKSMQFMCKLAAFVITFIDQRIGVIVT